MTFHEILTIGVVVLLLGLLVASSLATDVILLGGLTVLLAFKVLTPADALAGLANEGMVTVGVMYVIVAGLQETGATTVLSQRLLGRPASALKAQLALMLPVAGLSAFMNNTPVVAMFVPVVKDWARKLRFPASWLLMPLSYAAIMGGTCTLIGTSTNLVVNGMLLEVHPDGGLGIFAIGGLGLVNLALGMAYVALFSRRLLPDRSGSAEVLADPREYSVEMLVEPSSPLAGKTIEEAGLRHLPGLYVAEIERGGEVIPAVSPHERLHGGDRLLFVGVVGSVVDLQKFRGLVPATDQVFKLDAPRGNRALIEAVVSNSCPLIGGTIREGRFRTVYDAVVIAVARNGERLKQKIGDIVLRAGDTLLVEAHPSFVESNRNSRDFFLVSRVEDSTPPRHERALLALGILLALVGVVAAGLLDMLEAAMIAAGLMIVTRCCGTAAARRAVDWQVLITIAASLGIGRAMETTGLAADLARGLVGLAGSEPRVALLAVYLSTMLLTEAISNNAAAVLTFPIAVASAAALGVSHLPFVVAVMLAASHGYATPIGYQTNLMVQSAGGYKFMDFVRFGAPLDLVMMASTVVLAPVFWPF